MRIIWNMQTILRKYYAYNFFRWLSFWLPFITLHLQGSGLNYTQILCLLLISSLTQLFLEIPSGIFSDTFGRKTTLILSSTAKFLFILTIVYSYQFWHFAIAWILLGTSDALASGADSAFLYDTLKSTNREKHYKKTEGIAWGYGMFGMGVGAFLGSQLISNGFELPIILTGVAFFISMLISFSLKEPQLFTNKKTTKYFQELEVSLHLFQKDSSLLWLSLLGGTMIAFMLISHLLFQPYMVNAGIKIQYFGTIYLLFLMASVFSSLYAYKIERFIGPTFSLLLIPTGLGIHFFIMGTGYHVAGFLTIFLNQIIWGFIRPLIHDLLNQRVESSTRATVLSFMGFVQGIMVLIAPLLGHYGDLISLRTTFFIMSFFVFSIGFLSCVKILKTTDYKFVPNRKTVHEE